MKNLLLFLALSFLTVNVNAQSENSPETPQSSHLEELFVHWDDQRGTWLYNAIGATVTGREIPQRPEGSEYVSTYEVLEEIPSQRIERMKRSVETEIENENNRNPNGTEVEHWNQWLRILERTSCDASQGRSTGDPHMVTYDGLRYDFQNAGDYLLTASNDLPFEVQVRQKRHNSKVSLNGAASIYINGDLVNYYGQDNPNENHPSPLYINGEPMDIVTQEAFGLANGGAVRKVNNRWVVFSPFGEQVQLRPFSFSSNNYVDVDVFAPTCDIDYTGLLGDGDGNRQNDLSVQTIEGPRVFDINAVDASHYAVFGAGRKEDAQKIAEHARLEFISRDFGDQFILDLESNNFEIPWLDIADEIRYPENYLTLSDLTDEQIAEGLKLAEEMGFAEEDFMAVVYDYGYVGLVPELPAEIVTNASKDEDVNNPLNNKEIKQTTRTNTRNPTMRPPRRHRGMIPPVMTMPPAQTPPSGTRTPSGNGRAVRTPSTGGSVRTPSGGR